MSSPKETVNKPTGLMDRIQEIYKETPKVEKKPEVELPSIFADKEFYDSIREKYDKVTFDDFLCIVALSEGMTLVKAGCTYLPAYKKYTNSKDAPAHIPAAVRQRLKRINGFELLQELRERKWEMGNYIEDIADNIVDMANTLKTDIMADDGYDDLDKMKAMQMASKIVNDRLNLRMRDKELNAKKEMGSGEVKMYFGNPPDCDLEVLNEDGTEKEKVVEQRPKIVVFNGSL